MRIKNQLTKIITSPNNVKHPIININPVDNCDNCLFSNMLSNMNKCVQYQHKIIGDILQKHVNDITKIDTPFTDQEFANRDLIFPISMKLLVTVGNEKYVYSREYILDWLERGNITEPMTHQLLQILELKPDKKTINSNICNFLS